MRRRKTNAAPTCCRLQLLCWLILLLAGNTSPWLVMAEDQTCQVDGTCNDDIHSLYTDMVQWIQQNGGVVDTRQDFQDWEMMATDDIPANTELLRIPWKLIIAPLNPTSAVLCETVQALETELELKETSFYTPFIKLLQTRPLTVPDGWSFAGQHALKTLLGNVLPPRDVGRNVEWYTYHCKGSLDNHRGVQAALNVVAHRSPGLFTKKKGVFQEVIIPHLDLYSHANGPYWNVEVDQNTVGRDFILKSRRFIQKGEVLHLSKSFGQAMEISDLFRDFGRLTGPPLHFSLHFGGPYAVDFDIEETTEEDDDQPPFQVKWAGGKLPSRKSIDLLEEQLERLEYFMEYPDELGVEELPSHEAITLERYHRLLMNTMGFAVRAGHEASVAMAWVQTPFTITDFNVAGANLGRYGIDEFETPEEGFQEEPFELFADFDIGHLITGHETWDDLVKYRNELKRPSLSFYVDKVARKRWLSTQGFDQATQYALYYKFELFERNNITTEEEIETVLKLLSAETDYAAKPTHHSETSGVWLVDYDEETNTTRVSSTARQLMPGNSFNPRDAATALVKNLHAEAAKHESWVLKNVKPGLVVEERFGDVDGFDKPPLEFCIFTIFGRVWGATMNYVNGQKRELGGFVYRNGTLAVDSHLGGYIPIPFDYVDWPKLVDIAESLGANKDMFRTDIFVGVAAGYKGKDRKAHAKILVSECELHPTTTFYSSKITDEGARLWIAGYKMGNYRTIPNTEVPEEFWHTGYLSSSETAETNANMREQCRRHPTWRGDGVDAKRCAEVTGYNPHHDDLFNVDSSEFPKDDSAWFNRIIHCMDERTNERNLTQPNNITEPQVATMYPPEAPVVVILENAYTEAEVATVQDLTMCMQKYHGESLLEHRPFTYAGKGGNDCTYLGGFLQLFTPGISRQMYHNGLVGWLAAKWGIKDYEYDKHGFKYPFPDPRVTGLRTSGHLSYEGWEELGLHSDDGSLFDVLGVFSGPSEYEGGEFFLQPSTRPATPENLFLVKPERRSAVVFLSEEKHGVQKIHSGHRETWGNELWAFDDVPAGVRRPGPPI